MREPILSLGNTAHERLSVRILRRNYPEVRDYWDGNWVTAEITLASGSFRAKYEADLRTTEFVSFREELVPLYRNLAGTASFAPMEPWLEVEVAGDGRGHFRAVCVARDDFAEDREFRFTVSFDQTELAEVIRSLDWIVEQFPIVGSAS